MASQIDTLLRLVPDSPQHVLTHISSHPTLAHASDSTGYSLLHAAASYNQLELLRTLVNTYHANVNITDSDGETPLFTAEILGAAKCLVEELGADITVRNEEGSTAEENARENAEDGGGWVEIADYLERRRLGGGINAEGVQEIVEAQDGDIGAASLLAVNGDRGEEMQGIRVPPPLPPGVKINVGTMHEEPLEGDNVANGGGGVPDPEFRRRIEELAARDDFHGEEAQTELRKLVEDAVGGLGESQSGRDVRRRID